jgi:uncharacterized protein
MITISFEFKANLFTAVTIEGHSNYDKKGSDIVCAGVSAIGVGSLNAISEITNTKPHYKMEDGYLHIEFDETDKVQLIAEVMSIQLRSIEENYGKYVKITYRR